ncbi:hypothetical protein EJD97_022834 [Solanum chilense]|uniref:FMN hydroxy acid dehydrogenase domain-containing protein n=1 Tax=Solanum chilense TaxID=4083 RepID=A0A6N2C6N0_SOLCI|nr:hypothetical protein EJD97_022834 [Solanum chilense]
MAGEPVDVNEFEELVATQVLPKISYDFFSGGAEDQHTLKENIEAFHRIIIQPTILVDVSRIDMSTVIHKTSAPIMIAPTMMHKFAHPEGEITTARGAASCNVIAGLSFTCKAVGFIQIFVTYYSQLSLSSYVNNDFSCFATDTVLLFILCQ